MALVSIETLRQQVLRTLDKLVAPAGLELLSYKRNRTIRITVLDDGRYFIEEDGFVKQEMTVEQEALGRILKTLFKREFPRSRKVRLYRFDDPAARGLPRKKI